MHHAVSDWIAFHALWSPDRPALVDLESERSFTYFQMNARCSKLAAFLSSRKEVGYGDRVAVLAQNSSDILEIQFACMKLGAIFVPVNWRLAGAEISLILHNAEPSVLIHGPEFAAVAEAALQDRAVKHILTADNGQPSDYEAGIAAHEPIERLRKCELDDVWSIMYTSGTTGLPKGALVTYRMAAFTGLHGMLKAGVTQESCGLTFLPLFHVGGLFLMANMIFHSGGKNVIMKAFDPTAALQALTDLGLGISHAFGVPTNFLLMAQLPEFSAVNLKGIRSLFVGGAPSPLSLLEAYAEKGIGLQQAWGMTETTTIGTLLDAPNAISKIGSVGRALPYIEAEIIDSSGVPVTGMGMGELVVRGATVTPGYWRSPIETERSFHNGWFHTGDVARRDDEGFYYIVDRWKDMYISGGENVYPAEIESVLHGMPGVLEAAVFGIPDERWGEVGCAYICVDTNVAISVEDVKDYCRARLAHFKLPKVVEFVEGLPHTAAGKIAKPELRKRFSVREAGQQSSARRSIA